MPLVEKLHAWLVSGPTPDCDDILAAALEKAESGWFERLVSILVQRGRTASWAGLIGIYDRLPPDVRRLLAADQNKLEEALGLALKAPAASARLNGIRVFREHGSPKLLFLLVSSLRDSSTQVRVAAGEALRNAANAYFQRVENGPGAQQPELIGMKRALATAAQETLRTYDLHHRNEALQVAAWFAAEIGPAFWEQLNNPRARAAHVIADQLYKWDEPRMAGFFIGALGQTAWRSKVIPILQAWGTTPQIIAMLRVGHLLDDNEIRAHAVVVRGQTWRRFADRMDDVPEGLRASAPRWLNSISLTDAERSEILGAWARSQCGALRRSAVYALAENESVAAKKVLRDVSGGVSREAQFARWVIAGAMSQVNAQRARTEVERKIQARQAAFTPPPEEPELDTSFPILWMACRRTGPSERAELLRTIRENSDVWRNRLRTMTQSADARDRLLFLQVVGTAELAGRFRRDVESLLKDSVDSIIRLAGKLTCGLPVDESPGDADDPPKETPKLNLTPVERGELKQLLDRLESDPDAARDPAVVARVREFLQSWRPNASAELIGSRP